MVKDAEGRNIPRPQILVKGFDGRFLPLADRYTKDVASIWVYRRGLYVAAIEPDITGKPVTPADLVRVLAVDEFENLPEATRPLKDYESTSKYAAWDVAQQIDATRGIRRKLLKIDMEIQHGGRKKVVSFYTRITSPKQRSYQLFKQMNEAIGSEGAHFYKAIGGRIIADRVGTKAILKRVTVKEVI